jgi:hypothetical protein
MSLEAKIELLTEAITRLIDALNTQQTSIVVPTAPAAQVAAPVVQAAPVAPTVAAPAMPAPPTFVAPVLEAAPTGAPFTDGKGLIDYVMSAYKQMGAEKGARIQNVLMSMNYQNINDVKPEHYGALYQGIEALKG